MENIKNEEGTTYFFITGMKFVITGILSQSRNYFTGLIEYNKGIVLKSVSSNTDFLLIGEKAAGSKLAKAEKLGVKILTEKEFYDILNRK